LSDILKKIERRKSLHFNITSDAHSALRIACFKHKITMQEFFEEISQRIIIESPEVMTLMSDLSERKKHKEIQKISKSDENSLYSIIEDSSPFGDQ
jgi:hypothetical protein|tara:strand:- start:6892 stop:7179 length:288 start_codon:yes stop_codon:yes gene_type:complete